MPVQAIAAGIVIVITLVAGRSADFTLKLQIPIMIAVGLSILALVAGVFSGPLQSPETGVHYERSAPAGFWFVFAVFFPAVTGFTAGVGMSGDLKDSRRSIPTGTILAVISGFIIYALILVLLAITGKVNGEALANIDPRSPPVWTQVALLGGLLIYPGMWGAILSSAFGSALGGPRVLQALAMDGLAPKFLSRLSKTGQPTVATWITGAIALLAVLLGDLNAVGRLVTIFFLTLYVTINLSAALEKLAREPSYRPTLKIPAIVSVGGCAAALAVMFLINPLVCIIAISLEAVLLLILRRRMLEHRWGDVWAGVWNSLARFALLRLRETSSQARNWRPHILLFTANPVHRRKLARLASGFNQERGIVTVCQVVVGKLESDYPRIPELRQEMESAMEAEGLGAFCEVNIVRDFQEGVVNITQANGYAGLQSNTVMFGWPDDPQGMERILRMLSTISGLKVSSLLARLEDSPLDLPKETIDVWWRGKEHNGDLMLLLGHLLTLNRDWKGCGIRLRTVVPSGGKNRPETQKSLDELLNEVRIPAEVDVYECDDPARVFDLIVEQSSDAGLVFLGMRIPGEDDLPSQSAVLFKLGSRFRNVVFVHNAGDYAGELI